MSETDSIEIASRRLSAALDALEEAAEHRRQADRTEDALASQIHALGADRARLVGELDESAARTRALEGANRDVTQRLAAAIETIRNVLSSED